jgi:pimeloyl-ACP methyl ester carboxylesterase
MPSTIRFLKQYLRPAADATVEAETVYHRGAEILPATVYRPSRGPRELPGWVVLHGLTRPGRAHPSLQHFARAVASAGNIVFVPEIPEWRDLRVDPAITIGTIQQAVRALQSRDDVRHEHVGLFGFSFGASQALIAAADEDTARLLAGVAAWGGYSDLRRLFRFGLTGEHEIDGVTYQMQPDPYGCWIMAGNYLTRVPGYEWSGAVSTALHDLAIEAGERRLYAWDPVFDASKLRFREGLSADGRDLFDLIAPATTAPRRDHARVLDLAEALAQTALRADPLLDPQPFLPHVRVPILFSHGRDDRLIPFSETIRLSRAVPKEHVRSTMITALFQHSGGTQSGLGPIGVAREGARFALLLRRVLGLVSGRSGSYSR